MYFNFLVVSEYSLKEMFNLFELVIIVYLLFINTAIFDNRYTILAEITYVE